MGVHRKEPGRILISFLEDLGKSLDYHVSHEEKMFQGQSNSPELDLAWRNNPNAKYPLFIFEIESLAAKSSSDNAVKVFSRRTSNFEKPLYFFHIFVDDSIGEGRIEYLKENYDKTNYNAYSIHKENDFFDLIKDVLEQHLRLNTYFDVFSVVNLLKNQAIRKISIVHFLELLINYEYDTLPESDYLLTLERLQATRRYPEIRDFYLNYLARHLANEKSVKQSYRYLSASCYSSVIHYGLLLNLNPELDRGLIFHKLRKVEEGFRPWSLWEPNFGMSRDHDEILLSHFPMLLTLLCLGFSGSKYASYFSNKLADILKKIRNFGPFNLHGLIWLLIASVIAEDDINYEYARSLINSYDGLALEWITKTCIGIDDLDERMSKLTSLVEVVSYKHWSDWLSPYLSASNFASEDLLVILLEAFLIMDHPFWGLEAFADYCLRRSVAN